MNRYENPHALHDQITSVLQRIVMLREQRNAVKLEVSRDQIDSLIRRDIEEYKALIVRYDELDSQDRDRKRALSLGLDGIREAFARDEMDIEEMERLLPYMLEEPGTGYLKPGEVVRAKKPQQESLSATMVVGRMALGFSAVMIASTVLGFVLALLGVR